MSVGSGEASRRWVSRNRHKQGKYSRDWQVRNPEKVRKYSDAYSNRVRESIPFAYEALGNRCAWCGGSPPKFEFDHVYGSDRRVDALRDKRARATVILQHAENRVDAPSRHELQLMCRECHVEKSRVETSQRAAWKRGAQSFWAMRELMVLFLDLSDSIAEPPSWLTGKFLQSESPVMIYECWVRSGLGLRALDLAGPEIEGHCVEFSTVAREFLAMPPDPQGSAIARQGDLFGGLR